MIYQPLKNVPRLWFCNEMQNKKGFKKTNLGFKVWKHVLETPN
jgi:hypothetical protein